MISDPRIKLYRRAAEQMARGIFDPDIPTGGEGEMGDLGRALTELGTALKRRISELRALLEVTGKINSGMVIEEVLDYIYESFSEIIPYDRIGCALIDPVQMMVRAIWARAGCKRLELGPGYAAALEQTSLDSILESGKPRILNDLQAYLRDHPESDATRRIVNEGHSSSLTCPLIVNGRPVGFLFFSSRERGAYAGAHADTYLEIASHISMIVEKGRLHKELLETKRRLVEANQALVELANLDGLTGLPNRRHFDLLFKREWSRASRYGEPLSVIVVDIDYFKQYNDLHGHLAGDACLKRVAEALSRNTQRGTDLVARLGGEEFVILLPATDIEGAGIMAERLRKRVEALKIRHHGSSISDHVTVSLGVAGGPPRQGQEMEELLRVADSALYRAKSSGRNRVETFVEPDSAIWKHS
jgi:diguanylate cyclase (GGDEF)-like protein